MEVVESVFKIIERNVRTIGCLDANEPIGFDSYLCLLGLGSIERVELIQQTLEDLGLNLRCDPFYEAGDLGELAWMMAQKLNKKMDGQAA